MKFPSKNGTGLYPGIRHKYMYIHFFPQFPMAFQETLCRGLKGVVLTKRMTDHVQKVCGKITLTLNFKKPANENMGFR